MDKEYKKMSELPQDLCCNAGDTIKVSKYIRNRENFKAKESSNFNPLVSEEVLGQLAAVEEMAGVWAKYKEHFKTIEYSLLLDFVNTDQYDNARLDAYRMGLGAMNHVLEQCYSDVYERNQKPLQ